MEYSYSQALGEEIASVTSTFVIEISLDEKEASLDIPMLGMAIYVHTL